jgi:DNA-binding NarL/FixJ family response regulator
MAGRVDCDLVIVGLGPERHEVEEVRELKDALPGLHILAVGPAAGTALALQTVAHGASGYLDMSRAREDLVKAVRAVCRGHGFVSAASREPSGGPASAAS